MGRRIKGEIELEYDKDEADICLTCQTAYCRGECEQYKAQRKKIKRGKKSDHRTSK